MKYAKEHGEKVCLEVLSCIETDESGEEIFETIDDDDEFEKVADMFDDMLFGEEDYDN